MSEGTIWKIVRDVAKKAGIRGEDYKKLDPSKVRKVSMQVLQILREFYKFLRLPKSVSSPEEGDRRDRS